MRGVPWDPLLDVLPSRKRKAVTGSRLPVLLENAPAPPSPRDEAGSDSPSPEAIGPVQPEGPPVEGGVGSEDSMSVSLPGESMDGSHHSEELIMDVDGHPVNPHVNAIFLEGEMPTGHEDNEGYMEADEDPLASSFDVDWTIGDGEDDDVPEVTSTDLPFVKSWANRKYEEGPPVLHPDQLRKLDEAMDQVELNRLVAMKVLRPMSEEENLEGMTNLQSKYVRDWRFRPSEDGKTWSWVRRSRLVAKEFKFIDPLMEHLYAPGSLACLQKLFAGLVCSCPRLCLFTGDIKDAYLTVPQRRPTFIRHEGLIFELKFNLPGQRAGARDFYDKLAGILKDDGVESFEAAPAFFIEPKTVGVSAHVDDFEVISEPAHAERLKKKLKDSGLKFSLEGPCTVEGGECHFLKRKFVGAGDGIVVSQDGKHIDKLVELLGLQKATGKNTPCPMNVNHSRINPEPLDADRHSLYRTCVGILLYLGQDRPESLYAIKQLSGCCTCPTETDWSLLRHLVKFLKAHPNQGIKLTPCRPGRTLQQKCMGLASKVRESKENILGEGHLLEAISDASWAGERDKKSMSAMTLFLSGNMIHASNRRQKSISLSSCESELHGSLAAVQEGIFLKRVLERLCGSEVLLQHRVDSSSCRAVISKQGLPKLRHVEIAFLWIQEKLKMGESVTGAISTKFCPPDLLTKPTGGARTKLLCYMMGVVQNGEVVGQAEFDEELVRHELKRAVKVESKSTLQAVRQVILSACVFMEATTLAEGYEFSGMSTDVYCLTCFDLDLRMPSMNMAEALVVGVLSLAFLLLVTLLVVRVQQKLRDPMSKLLRLPFQPFSGVPNGLIFLILNLAVPVATRNLESRSDDDMSPEQAVYHQSQRRSWRSGSGDTTLISEMVMISQPPTEGTKTWLILVSLVVCLLTVVLTSCWTASMVKGMLKKFLLGGQSSLHPVPIVPTTADPTATDSATADPTACSTKRNGSGGHLSYWS